LDRGGARPVNHLRLGLLIGLVVGLLLTAALGAYALQGWLDAERDAPGLRARAAAIEAEGRGVGALRPDQLRDLLAVEDPAFRSHHGVDVQTPGAGATTITQSLAKRVAFQRFRPGLGKVRQTAYALSLERRLSKDEILALWLETAEMGEGRDGWVRGLHAAAQAFYGKATSELAPHEFHTLVAVCIAPGALNPLRPNPALRERVGRIERLLAGICAPKGPSDEWLEGCAAASAPAGAGG